MSRTKGSKGKKNKQEVSLEPVDKHLQEKLKDPEFKKELEKETEKLEVVKLTPEQIERRKKLEETMKKINTTQKNPTALQFGSAIEPRIRQLFGYAPIDKLTGGLVRGLFHVIWGSKGCAKTTLACMLAGKAQKDGLTVAWIDAEHSFDPVWANKQGVDVDNLVYFKPETLEKALDAAITLCRDKVVDVIVLDSIHSMCPKGQLYEGKGENEKSMEQDTRALRARKLGQFFEMAMHYVSESKCAVLLLGQSRIAIGAYVSIESLSGGHALLHNSRLILRVRRGQGNDAPKDKIETDEIALDKDGNQKINKKTGLPVHVFKEVDLGFDLVMHVEKSQIEHCREKDEVHVPFYYEQGFGE